MTDYTAHLRQSALRNGEAKKAGYLIRCDYLRNCVPQNMQLVDVSRRCKMPDGWFAQILRRGVTSWKSIDTLRYFFPMDLEKLLVFEEQSETKPEKCVGEQISFFRDPAVENLHTTLTEILESLKRIELAIAGGVNNG